MAARSIVLVMLAALTFNLLPYPAQAEFQKLRASDGAAGDYFGWSVSIDGDTAVVGAMGDDDKGEDSGSAYVFVRSATGWIQQAKLTAEDGAATDQFGCSVSISGDTAVIANGNGNAYVFVRSGTVWTQQAKLAADGEFLGWSVAVSGDTAVIGAATEENTPAGNGKAYVFVRSGTAWTQQAKLTASDGTANDLFGFSVSLSGDTAVIAASGNDFKSGWAYVFVRSGTMWTQQAKLSATPGGEDVHAFSWTVSISGDTVVVSEEPLPFYSGWAYVYVRSGTTWTQQAKLTLPAQENSGAFGCSVSVFGNIALVSSPGDGATGSAYVFFRSGTNWTQTNKLIGPYNSTGDSFGGVLSLSGNSIVIGAKNENNNSGAAYIISTDYSPTRQAKTLPAIFRLLLGKQ